MMTTVEAKLNLLEKKINEIKSKEIHKRKTKTYITKSGEKVTLEIEMTLEETKDEISEFEISTFQEQFSEINDKEILESILKCLEDPTDNFYPKTVSILDNLKNGDEFKTNEELLSNFLYKSLEELIKNSIKDLTYYDFLKTLNQQEENWIKKTLIKVEDGKIKSFLENDFNDKVLLNAQFDYLKKLLLDAALIILKNEYFNILEQDDSLERFELYKSIICLMQLGEINKYNIKLIGRDNLNYYIVNPQQRKENNKINKKWFIKNKEKIENVINDVPLEEYYNYEEFLNKKQLIKYSKFLMKEVDLEFYEIENNIYGKDTRENRAELEKMIEKIKTLVERAEKE